MAGEGAGRANSKKYLVTGPIRRFCALHAEPSKSTEPEERAGHGPIRLSEPYSLARWTVWILIVAADGAAGRGTSKKDLVTGPI